MIGVDGGEEDRPYPAVGERAGDEIILHGTAVRAGWQVARVDELKQALVTPEHRVGDVQVDHVPVHVAGLNLRPDLGQAAIVVLQAHLDPGGGGERHVVRLLAGPCVGSRRRKPRSAPDPPQAAHSGSVPQAAQRHSQAIGRYAVGSISCAHHLVATPHVQVSLCVNCRQAHSGSVPQAAQRHSQAIGRYAVGSISCAHHLVATPHVQVSLCVNCRQSQPVGVLLVAAPLRDPQHLCVAAARRYRRRCAAMTGHRQRR